MNRNEVLLLPDKSDIERDGLAETWKLLGGEVLKVGKFWEKPDVDSKEVTLYGFTTFCFVLAELLDLALLSPRDELIAKVDKQFLKRAIAIRTIGDIGSIEFPKFVKPVNPKIFEAKVYPSATELRTQTEGIENNEMIIISEIIAVEKEVRSFILNEQTLDLAYYEGDGELEAAKQFIQQFLDRKTIDLPESFVLDIGFNKNLGCLLWSLTPPGELA